jgi:hypothetical protein
MESGSSPRTAVWTPRTPSDKCMQPQYQDWFRGVFGCSAALKDLIATCKLLCIRLPRMEDKLVPQGARDGGASHMAQALVQSNIPSKTLIGDRHPDGGLRPGNDPDYAGSYGTTPLDDVPFDVQELYSIWCSKVECHVRNCILRA